MTAPQAEREWLALYGDLARDLALEDPSLVAALRRRATTTPHRCWLRYAGRDIDFASADRWTDALAAGLAALGVEPGDRVAVCLQNLPQWPLVALGVWKAGGTVVAVSPLLLADEAGKLLTDSGSVALVAEDAHWADVLSSSAAAQALSTVLTTSPLDLAGEVRGGPLAACERRAVSGTTSVTRLVARHDGERPAVAPPEPGQLALLTYTSGTTGPSKGAMNTHANVAAGGQVYRDWTGVTADDVIAGLAPLFHVTGITGHLAVSLAAGAPLVLGYRFRADHVLQLLEESRATFTVAAMTALLSLVHAPERPGHDLTCLRKVWSGGQAVAAATVDLLERDLGVYVRVAYGMTETTYPSHLVPHHLRAPVDQDTGTLSVGIPTPGLRSWVVDDDGAPIPHGEVGEIVVTGPGIVPGYWERPEETATTMPGGVLHTGDVGYRDAEGWFYVVDRKKDLINASGFKVWPREVEDVLYGHPAVREAAVVGRADPVRGEVVTAFVSLVPGATVAGEDLVAWSRERLAAYKYPRVVEIVDEVPKTATGKVLRRALRTEH